MELDNDGCCTRLQQTMNVKKEIKQYVKLKIKRRKIAVDIKDIDECQKTNTPKSM